MFEFIAELLVMLPSDAEIGTMIEWMKQWVVSHALIALALYEALRWLVKKTPWVWDNKALEWIKGKIWKKNDA